MPGYKQVIPLHLGSTPLGKFSPHALATRPGTLFVADMQDTATIADLPAVGSTIDIPNAAYSVAKNLLPAGTTKEQTAGKFKIFSGTTSAEAVFERTPKGGIHGVINKSGAGITPGHGGGFFIPDPVLEYMRTHTANRFGISMWAKITRESSNPATGSTFPQMVNIGGTSSKGNALFSVSQENCLVTVYKSGLHPNPGNYEGRGGEETTVVGLFNISFSTKWNGVIPTAITSLAGGAWWGANGGNSNVSTTLANTFASWILYNFTIEDLTVSGVTTSQFEASVAAETAREFGVGGRFYGDTHQAPLTVFP